MRFWDAFVHGLTHDIPIAFIWGGPKPPTCVAHVTLACIASVSARVRRGHPLFWFLSPPPPPPVVSHLDASRILRWHHNQSYILKTQRNRLGVESEWYWIKLSKKYNSIFWQSNDWDNSFSPTSYKNVCSIKTLETNEGKRRVITIILLSVNRTK